MPKRKASWAMLIWTVLIVLWIVAGVGSLGPTSNDAQAAGQAVGATLGVGFIMFIWFIGFVILFLVWFMTRPKQNVTVYGPEGQAVALSEKDARKRVDRGGWTYTPPGRA